MRQTHSRPGSLRTAACIRLLARSDADYSRGLFRTSTLCSTRPTRLRTLGGTGKRGGAFLVPGNRRFNDREARQRGGRRRDAKRPRTFIAARSFLGSRSAVPISKIGRASCRERV